LIFAARPHKVSPRKQGVTEKESIARVNIIHQLRRRPPALSVERGRALPARGRPVLTHTAAIHTLVLALLAGVFLFGLIGISVARADEAYHAFIWVPRLLVVASGLLIVAILVRAVARWRR
jgi:hypothetical protein